jgi:type IV pilus assembly protein PilF
MPTPKYIFILSVLLFSSITLADSITAAKLNAELGLSYLSKGLYIPAKARLMDAIQDDPHSAESWYSMAIYAEKTGDVATAKTDYEKAMMLDVHSGAAKNNAAIFLCRQKDYRKAIALFLSAAAEPQYLHAGMAYKNAGVCAMKIPNYTLANQYLQMALRYHSNQLGILLQLSKLNVLLNNQKQAVYYFSQFKILLQQNNHAVDIAPYQKYVFG